VSRQEFNNLVQRMVQIDAVEWLCSGLLQAIWAPHIKVWTAPFLPQPFHESFTPPLGTSSRYRLVTGAQLPGVYGFGSNISSCIYGLSSRRYTKLLQTLRDFIHMRPMPDHTKVFSIQRAY